MGLCEALQTRVLSEALRLRGVALAEDPPGVGVRPVLDDLDKLVALCEAHDAAILSQGPQPGSEEPAFSCDAGEVEEG